MNDLASGWLTWFYDLRRTWILSLSKGEKRGSAIFIRCGLHVCLALARSLLRRSRDVTKTQ